MDYYSALNSLSSQSQSLDYASQTLLGGVADTTSAFTKLQSELSSDVSGITADAQASITKITSAFDAKATAQERLVAGLEGGAMGIEAVKKTRESVKKYTEQEEGNAKIKAEAKSKEASVEPEAGGGGEEVVSRGGGSNYRSSRVADADDGGGVELAESKSVELGDTRGAGLATDRGSLPSVNPTETPLDPPAYTGSRLPVTGNDATGWDLSSVGEGQAGEAVASSEGAVASATEGAVAGGESAMASIEAGAGEIALAGGAGLDVVADAVAGAVALVGLGVGLYDLFDKSAKNKEKKQEKKAEDAKEEQETEAQSNYDTKISNLDTQYGSIRSNITSNTHSAIVVGVQSLRNTYKSSGTF